jgi:ribosomal protein S18 acetylase RimI-like enzyme
VKDEAGHSSKPPSQQPPPIRLRPFEAADSAAVDVVALAAFEQYRGVYDDWERLERAVGRMSGMAGEAELVVAEAGGAVAGAAAYCPPFSAPRAEYFEPHWPLIRMLLVAPEARGLGIGRSLTLECIERARRDGAGAIALHTSPAMAVALALYLRLGFRLERRVPDAFGVPYAVYLLDL